MEVEFVWVVGGVGGGGVQSHFRVKPNSVEVVLRLSWGCDKKNVCPDFEQGRMNSNYVTTALPF